MLQVQLAWTPSLVGLLHVPRSELSGLIEAGGVLGAYASRLAQHALATPASEDAATRLRNFFVLTQPAGADLQLYLVVDVITGELHMQQAGPGCGLTPHHNVTSCQHMTRPVTLSAGSLMNAG